ncbi:hypothetical protein RIF29_15598 [Crotalaria pallida]|uniref:Protein FAR1-RELATED SEQUENCE n=1 Tax=Crotalaria pallida TaxID=3830 RepID=A0AAN9FFU6_CROPI
MVEESSSNVVVNVQSESDLGDDVNEVEDLVNEDDMDCDEDVGMNGDDQYRIDGMDDIGLETPSYMIYTVAYYRNGRKAWRVSYDADSLQIKCCCHRFESQGIPCAHIFVVLFFLDIGELPKSVILQGHELGAIEQGNWMGDNLIYSRLGGLMSCCRRLCNLASRNADDYKSVREKVSNKIMLLEGKSDVGEGGSSQGNCSGIMEPTPLKKRRGGGMKKTVADPLVQWSEATQNPLCMPGWWSELRKISLLLLHNHSVIKDAIAA